MFPFFYHYGNTTILPLLQLLRSMALAQPSAEFPIDSYSIFLLYSCMLYTFILIHNIKHSSRLSPSQLTSSSTNLSNITLLPISIHNITVKKSFLAFCSEHVISLFTAFPLFIHTKHQLLVFILHSLSPQYLSSFIY